MNAVRRKRLKKIADELSAIIDEEDSAYENLPESIQSSERGEIYLNTSDALTEARDSIQAIADG